MTEIGWMWGSYTLLPKIILVELTERGFLPRTLTHLGMGIYDPDYGRLDESYQPGKFMGWDDETDETKVLWDDSKYKNAEGYCLSFAHKRFGMYPGLRILGDKDTHIQHIISTNQIRPQDVMKELENGDIIFFANLETYPPHSITQQDGTQETALEVTPHLSPEDLGRLAKDAGFFRKIKEQYVREKTRADDLDSQLFIKTTEAISAETVCVQQQHKVNQLLQMVRMALDKVTNLGIHIQEKLETELNIIDGEHNIGFPLAPSTRMDWENMTKTSALLQDNLHYIEAEIKSSTNISESKKWTLCTQVRAVVGEEFWNRFTMGTEHRIETTPIGMRNMITPQNNTQELIQYMQSIPNDQKLAFEALMVKLGIMDARGRAERAEETKIPGGAVPPRGGIQNAISTTGTVTE